MNVLYLFNRYAIPTDYRHTDKHLRLVTTPKALYCSAMRGQSNGRYQVHLSLSIRSIIKKECHVSVWWTTGSFFKRHCLYIFACQRGGVSNKPPWQQEDKGPGILWSVHRWTSHKDLQKFKRKTNRTFDPLFTKTGWAWHVTICMNKPANGQMLPNALIAICFMQLIICSIFTKCYQSD